jgi:signal transduction histidine kinase
MDMENFRQRPLLAWVSVTLLVVLCAVLAVLQYRWIGEITEAERGRLHDALQSRVNALSRSFNEEISKGAYALFPPGAQLEELGREKAYAAQYLRWKESHERIFHRIALAVPEDDGLQLFQLDMDTAQLSRVEWPSDWLPMRQRLMGRLEGRGGGPGQVLAHGPALIELPRFGAPGDPGRGGRREQEWLLAELNMDYLRGTLLPELLNRYLGEAGRLDYEAEVVEKAERSILIYSSVRGRKHATDGPADASVALLEIAPGGFGGRGGPPRGPGGHARGPGGPPPPNFDHGRWQLLVRHSAGSIEALVARTRLRNLAISGAILVLILATIASLVRFSRRAQQLAELQINFVAGVSHELRTPVTVIRTAAFNLRGRMASRPDQVQKYGALIEAESEKLTALVEQVLRFASTMAGHVIRSREPVAMDTLLHEGLRYNRVDSQDAGVVVDKHIELDLPLVLADEVALQQALQNLVDNALKYGTEGSNWIGVSASPVTEENETLVEIRIADHGPGIPVVEQEHIFDPFFRGQRAVQDQVHGSGLGLYLVKKIVEAHGGTIRVKSEPMKGTEFILRIPAAPPELQDEFAHTLD